jgi:hypothetical protein
MSIQFAGKLRSVCGALGWAALCAIGLSSADAALTRLDLSYSRDFPVLIHDHGSVEFTFASAIQAHIAPDQSSTGSSPVPEDMGHQFEVFLVEVPHGIFSDAYYLPGSLSAGQNSHHGPPWNENGIFAAANLYRAFAGGANPSTWRGRLEGGALQAAIWDVLYGDGRRVNNYGSSFSMIGNPQLIARANAMLASPANSPDHNLDGTFWRFVYAAYGQGGRQGPFDLLGPTATVAVVPEPGAYAAGCVAGLYALGHCLQRRARK